MPIFEPQLNTSRYRFLIIYFSINFMKTDIVQCCSVKASLVSLHQIHQTGLWNTSTLIKRVFPYQPILHLLSTLKLAYEWNARFEDFCHVQFWKRKRNSDDFWELRRHVRMVWKHVRYYRKNNGGFWWKFIVLGTIFSNSLQTFFNQMGHPLNQNSEKLFKLLNEGTYELEN